MKIGLCAANVGACTQPNVLGRVAEHAEAAGLESLWVSEHLVLADPRRPPSPMDPEEPILEPVVSLAYAAARTTTLRLGTGVIVLPLRNPLVLAKELATLDVLSGGRVMFGIGVGYVEREFRALGASFEDRGDRTDEYLGAMLALWTEDHPSFEGRFYAFEGVRSHPRPLQQPPSVVIGGWSPPALRRAAERGNGWYGWGMDHAETASTISRLRAVLAGIDRDPALGDI
ncbi:MAG TPA: LLM class F420-dependent oxidoreductase, partial [Actinomycetota bacterium]|nr:LLM class F420-dependent oxidoreductase [Actinomycetota bacterium]